MNRSCVCVQSRKRYSYLIIKNISFSSYFHFHVGLKARLKFCPTHSAHHGHFELVCNLKRSNHTPKSLRNSGMETCSPYSESSKISACMTFEPASPYSSTSAARITRPRRRKAGDGHAAPATGIFSKRSKNGCMCRHIPAQVQRGSGPRCGQ